MDNTDLKAFKELKDPQDLAGISENHCYPKPNWMLNESIYDTTWKISLTGFEIDYSKNLNHGRSVSFERHISTNELLTDRINQPLLEDLRSSLLYLNVAGQISRPERIADILSTACHLIRHANEIQKLNNKEPIRSFEQINLEHLKDYLLSFQVEKHIFDGTLDLILGSWSSKSEIDWDLVKKSAALTTRKFNSLKHKLTKYLEANTGSFGSENGYIPQYDDASTNKFDEDFDLAPAEKTISNEISKLEALYTSRPSQKYKFRHSSMAIFSCGKTIFDEMIAPKKTPLMPVNIALHTISSALHFVRIYGPALREYLSLLKNSEKNIIDTHGVSKSQNSFRELQHRVYKNTVIPSALKDLRITSWASEGDELSYNDFTDGMSVCMATRLYTAAIWILLASFTAGRSKSLRTLKRNCFKQSPVDGLFDLVMRIPKSSENLELEEVHRPIPDLIYDYGLEFAAFVCEIEDRRGLVAAENESFLFSKSVSYSSVTASTYIKETDVHQRALSDDYINATLSMFIDWIDSPLINEKRWYLRTHQFRRLFAVLYFNFSDEVGLEELSWFMGHANLDQTFHYAEVAPIDEWIEEAESTIAKIGSSLNKTINADGDIKYIVDKARETSNVSTVIEPLVRSLIAEHKKKTKQEVRFCKIDGEDVFFYFSEKQGDQ